MSWLRDRLRPPSSWDSFKRGTLAPAVRIGSTAIGALLGGAGGGAIGGALGGIGADAVAGENVRRSTTLRSVGGDALTGALAGYAAQSGPLGALLGKKAAGAAGGASKAAMAADLSVPASALTESGGGLLSTLGGAAKAAAPWVGPASQAALGYGQMQQQQRIADEGLRFLRSNYADRDAYRRQALALLQQGAPDTAVLIDDPTFRRMR